MTDRDRSKAETPSSPALIAGRYQLLELIGTGGDSRVHSARDLVTGARVAVKLLGAGVSASLRVHREISALRLLRLPGVIALLDEGTHDDSRFLVMDLVVGRPFPGTPTPTTWDALAPLVLALLEILGRVHAAGVVHRDLKPSNVLVGDDGRVTLLDFGISWGPSLGEAVTVAGTVVGTPEYLAPEQFVGAAGDARTDLYALGVMLYESLSGHQPHETTEFTELVALKRSQMPVPIRIAAPSVPRDVAVVLDQLLAMDPDDRPQSAGEAMQLLFGLRPSGALARHLPRLGGIASVARLVAAAEAGRSIDVSGPAGSGRSRLLADAADHLAALGRALHWVVPGSAPYASLASLLGGLTQLDDASHAEAVAEIHARIEVQLRAGVVVVVDDSDRADRWSAAALEACRSAGTVIRATDSPTDDVVRLAELAESDLRPLFAGPDRIFHFREDGAHELWRRTGGLPARIATEIAAWVRAGIAHWENDLVVIRRDALNRLRGGQSVGDELLLRPGVGVAGSAHLDDLLAWIAFAWPHATLELLAKATGQPRWSLDPAIEALAGEGMIRRLPDGSVQPLVVPRSLHSWPPERRRAAHHALSIALPPGTPLRLRHLAAAGEPEEVVDEAILLAPELTRQGRAGDAIVVLEEGLSAARRVRDRPRELLVLVEFAKTCLSGTTPHAIDRVLYEFGRTASDDAEIAQIERLLRGAKSAATGDAERALTLLAETGPLADLDLELWRQGQRFSAARRLSIEREEAVLHDIEAWAETSRHRRALASVASWKGLLLNKQGRYEEAARLHRSAAERTERVPGRMASHLNAGLALLDGGHLAEARSAAEALRELASSCRNAFFESHAEVQLRTIRYRLGDASTPDMELVEAVEAVGEPNVWAQALLTESAVAWRAGLSAVARDLASRSVHAYQDAGNDDGVLVARALGLACGAGRNADTLESLARTATICPDTEVAVQVLGLLALADPVRATELRAEARRRLDSCAVLDRAQRRQILSLCEVIEGLADPGP